jgi:hypothetical protein
MAEFHPLFPPSDEDDSEEEAPDIQEILVQRKENGKYVTAPRTFLAGELQSLGQLHAEFGGGEYQLIGRDSAKRIRRRAVNILPGPLKPMFDEGPNEPAKPVASSSPMMAMMGGGEGGIMGLVMMMMQQMMQSQQAASQQQSQMMMAFIQTMATGNSAQIQAAQESMNRQAERDARDKESQMAMLVKLTEARGAGNSSGGEDSFFKGVEFMRHFSTQQLEMMKQQAAGKGGSDFDLEGIIGTVLEALQGFNAFKEMSSGVPGAPSNVIPITPGAA